MAQSNARGFRSSRSTSTGFKNVNDTRGHHAGDRVLRRFAQILADCSRRTDLPRRLGGEEFVAFLVERDLNGVNVFAERVRSEAEKIQQKQRPSLCDSAFGATMFTSKRYNQGRNTSSLYDRNSRAT